MKSFLSALLVVGFAGCAASNPPVAGGWRAASLAATPARLHAAWTKTSIGTFGDPYGVAVNPGCRGSCDVFVSDPGNKTVYEVKPDGARRAIANFAELGSSFDPQGVAVDHRGDIFVADKAAVGGSYVYSVFGVGAAIRRLNQSLTDFPRYNRGVAARIFVGQKFRDASVYAAVATRHPLTTKGSVDCVEGTSCRFARHTIDDPFGVAVDDYNQVFVVDARGKHAYELEAHAAIDLGMTFVDPYGIAVTPNGEWIYVADAGAKKVFQRAPDGVWSEVGAFADPYAVAVQADRTLYVADPGSKHVWKLTP